MSSEGEKKAKLGFSKYRLLLWLVILGAAYGLFVKEFKPNGGGVEYSYTHYSDGKIVDMPSYICKHRFLLIYSTEDQTEQMNEILGLSPFIIYDFQKSYKGIKYRDEEKKGKSIFNGLAIPFLLIVLTILFERPIVRKLKKMNE